MYGLFCVIQGGVLKKCIYNDFFLFKHYFLFEFEHIIYFLVSYTMNECLRVIEHLRNFANEVLNKRFYINFINQNPNTKLGF